MAIFLPFHLSTDTPGVSSSSYKDMVVVLIQSLAHGQLFATSRTAACQTSLILHYLMEFLKLKSIESVMPSNHLILYYALFLLPSIFPASGSFLMSWLFSSGGQSIGASASASVLPMNISGLISFRMDWFDLLAVRQTLKNLLQHHTQFKEINSSVLSLLCSLLSHSYLTTGKIIALNIQIFISKVMSLFFNTLSSFVIAFLPKSKHILISLLCLPSAVIFGAQENKIYHCLHFFPFFMP